MDGDVDVDAVAVLASLGGLECSRAGQEPRPTRALLLCFYVPNALFLHMDSIFCSGRGSFLALSAAGLAGEAPVHYTRIWASVRSVARDLASSHGIAFRRARATQAHGNPNVIYLYIYSCFHLSVSEVPQQPSKALQAATIQQPRFKLFPL